MKIAAVQMDFTLGDVGDNVDRMTGRLSQTVANGAELTIFPECAATGYCFSSLDEALPLAETIPGPVTERMTSACAKLETAAIFGMLELDGDAGLFNAAVLVDGEGVVASYRKVHLPFLGVDRFATPGDREFAVHEVAGVRVGLNICYDSAFPEASLVLALQGADLIALPTNWPPGAECVAAHVINTRAMENGTYYAAVNRVGEERGFGFIGKSIICAPNGETLAQSPGIDEEILYADVDPQRARMKRVERVPGEHAIDRMADRRPEMYAAIVQPHDLKPPGRNGE